MGRPCAGAACASVGSSIASTQEPAQPMLFLSDRAQPNPSAGPQLVPHEFFTDHAVLFGSCGLMRASSQPTITMAWFAISMPGRVETKKGEANWLNVPPLYWRNC